MSEKKYAPRSMPAITRQSYDVERAPALPNWMDEFAANIEKQSVESQSSANRSIYDQINSIMGNKSKYPTVAAAVEDMKERSGMTGFLNKLQSQGETERAGASKKAQTNQPEKIKLFQDVPQLKETINNYCEGTYGNLPVPAIIEKLKSIHRGDVSDDSEWDDPAFLRYLNDKNISVKKKHPDDMNVYRDLGKVQNHSLDEEIDPSNDDAFHALNPAVVAK